MILQRALVNGLAIFAGGLLGLVFRRGIPAKMHTLLIQGLGSCVLVFGLQGLWKMKIFASLNDFDIEGSILGCFFQPAPAEDHQKN